MKGVFLWVSNICRQFLIGVARWGRGSPARRAAPQLHYVPRATLWGRPSNDCRCTRPVMRSKANSGHGLHFEGASATVLTEMSPVLSAN